MKKRYPSLPTKKRIAATVDFYYPERYGVQLDLFPEFMGQPVEAVQENYDEYCKFMGNENANHDQKPGGN